MALMTNLAELAVVLIEPSAMQANLMTRMLANQGVGNIALYDSGADALRALLGRRGNVVVMSSLYLPDMTGVDLVLRMRADPALETLPFLLVSSETRPQVLDPVRQSGACCIVNKPFSEAQLARALYAAADYLNPPDDLDIAEIESLRVLLVDDSLVARRHLRRLLDELGIVRVQEASNGKEAIAYLQESMVDLVITDFNMPEMDGRELTEYIRTQSWQNAVPVLMVTSEQNQGRLAAVERAGVSVVCDKPFDAGTVRKLISEAVLR